MSVSCGTTRRFPITIEDIEQDFASSSDSEPNVQDECGGEPPSTGRENVNDAAHEDGDEESRSLQDLLESAEERYLEASHAGEDPTETRDNTIRWQVDRTYGQHYYKWDKFIDRTEEEGFDGQKALELLQRPVAIDYGNEESTGSGPVHIDDMIYPKFYLDFISIVGRPMRPITRPCEGFFENVEVSLRAWHASYSAKHTPKLPFDLKGRTFRIATASSREHWYIVMHPNGGETEPSGKTAGERGTAMARHHAEAMASYFREVFNMAGLSGSGIDDVWVLGGERTKKIPLNKWTKFQYQFVQSWGSHVERYSYDSFWVDNKPCFHAFDYGANIEIEVTGRVADLAPEDYINADGEEETEEETEEEAEEVMAEQTEQPGEESLFVDDTESPGRIGSSPEEETEDADTQGDNATAANRRVNSTEREAARARNGAAAEEELYGSGLRSLRVGLEEKYALDDIETVSYALAVNLNCIEAAEGSRRAGQVACMLADRNEVAKEYHSNRDYRFYPLGFHPAYGNFSSPEPPFFLSRGPLNRIKHNMSCENDGADVVSFGYFQAYNSGLKQSIRDRPDELLASKGLATAALTVPSADVARSVRVRTKQKKLFSHLHGDLTPENPEASTPFAREKAFIERAIHNNEFAFRVELVIEFRVRDLVRPRRTFHYIIRPIFQLMRFFLQETDQYVPMLRRFPPAVFPGILAAFSGVFELAVEEMRQRYVDQGRQGLGLALSEGVAALDRLGHYGLTGDTSVLVPKIFSLTQTMDSLRKAAWPYINPEVLDLRRGTGKIHRGKWPKLSDGRPVLMHAAALAFHYGNEIAANRHSQLWFAEMGGQSIGSMSSANEFLESLFREVWVPETRAFLSLQIHRTLTRRARSSGPAPTQRALDMLRAWQEDEAAFTAALMTHDLLLREPGKETKIVPEMVRKSFGKALRDAVQDKVLSKAWAFAPTHATWPAVLRAALQHTGENAVTAAQWDMGIASAMMRAGIGWVPGKYRGRLTHTRAHRLVGEALSAKTLAARPGGLKRALLEADEQEERRKRVKKSRIEFGCEVPFTQVPRMVQEGFARLDKNFVSGNQRIREHYQVARMCLEKSIEESLVSLMLMIAVTCGSSTETPGVDDKVSLEDQKMTVVEHKEPKQLTAALVTRMLWYLKPDEFPWVKDNGMVLRIPEMTQKIGKKKAVTRLASQPGAC
ncbi:hypothetical protein K4F52_009471 [Lecanicillium sp. MT-2017a]|nr:hypothetical protein K4F52_009471 [Lecanicillium sp. MT-2017a]